MAVSTLSFIRHRHRRLHHPRSNLGLLSAASPERGLWVLLGVEEHRQGHRRRPRRAVRCAHRRRQDGRCQGFCGGHGRRPCSVRVWALMVGGEHGGGTVVDGVCVCVQMGALWEVDGPEVGQLFPSMFPLNPLFPTPLVYTLVAPTPSSRQATPPIPTRPHTTVHTSTVHTCAPRGTRGTAGAVHMILYPFSLLPSPSAG